MKRFGMAAFIAVASLAFAACGTTDQPGTQVDAGTTTRVFTDHKGNEHWCVFWDSANYSGGVWCTP